METHTASAFPQPRRSLLPEMTGSSAGRQEGRAAALPAVPCQVAVQGPGLAQSHRLQEFCSAANSRQIPFLCLFRFQCCNCIIWASSGEKEEEGKRQGQESSVVPKPPASLHSVCFCLEPGQLLPPRIWLPDAAPDLPGARTKKPKVIWSTGRIFVPEML